uniref:ATP-binding cassette sub-family D member 3 n=1 Tax=Timema monikensis TaxID=170555 RepID=A0A7R9EDW2_9NEOP|nr:unnamed protein product [Timema monikensis]
MVTKLCFMFLRKGAHADIQYVVGEKSTTKTKAQVDALFLRQLRKLLGIVVPGVFTPETGHLVLIAAALVARSLCDLWMIQTGTHIETSVCRAIGCCIISLGLIGVLDTLVNTHSSKGCYWVLLLDLDSSLFHPVSVPLGALFVCPTRSTPRLSRQEHSSSVLSGTLLVCPVRNTPRLSCQEHSSSVPAIVNMNAKVFRRKILLFALAMPFIALVNNVLKPTNICAKKLLSKLTVQFFSRQFQDTFPKEVVCVLYTETTKMTKTVNRGFTYYKMSNLDNRIANADQLLTTDVDKFCETVTDLYSNISKPMLDMSIYVYRLTTKLGWATPSLVFLYLLFAGFLLTYLRRPTGRMTVVEQKLEGEFRYINSRLITNSEEVAFYQGNHREKLTLLASFEKLTNHLRKFLEFRVGMGIMDNIIAKYLATVVGYYALAEAIGRLVLSGREMTRLAGFTTRVTELIKVLDDLNQGHYERTMITNGTVSSIITDKSGLLVSSGRIIFQDNIIRFDRVPLVTPNGDILIEELTFEVQSGINVLVCGPNGCGKSSLFRILGELWPLFGGTLTKPPRGKLFYIPQRPYMTLGTLRDQVIYPHTREEMTRRGRTDAELTQHLDRVKLSYLLSARENGWDAVEDWIDVLSGGEKQRIAMARLFYHKPQFAILDECTSAVSVDVEGSMYQYCRESGITLFTVSHRRSLWKHHEYYLRMDGRGAFEFKPIDTDTEEFGS